MGAAKWIEISLIGLGIAATAVIGYGQWNLGKQQNRQAELSAKATEKRELSIAKQAAELQIIELVHPHLEKFAACEPNRASQQMVSVSSTYLNSRHKSTVVADMAEELARECDDAIAQNTRTRIAEATVVVEEQKAIEDRKWFTVVATYDITRESDAKAAVVDLQMKVDAAAVEAQVNILSLIHI